MNWPWVETSPVSGGKCCIGRRGYNIPWGAVCMPRRLTHVVLGFETDDGVARSPLNPVSYGANKIWARLKRCCLRLQRGLERSIIIGAIQRRRAQRNVELGMCADYLLWLKHEGQEEDAPVLQGVSRNNNAYWAWEVACGGGYMKFISKQANKQTNKASLAFYRV